MDPIYIYKQLIHVFLKKYALNKDHALPLLLISNQLHSDIRHKQDSRETERTLP